MAEPGLRERKKQQTRREIVSAALHLFEDRGYEATTVADIARAAGISRATVFNYFPNKEDVLFADSPFRLDLVADVFHRDAGGGTPAAALTRVLDSIGDSGAWSVDFDGELLAVRAKLIATVPALRARALLEVADIQHELAELLTEHRPDVDPAEAAVLTGAALGALIAAVRTELERGGGRSLAVVARRAYAAALRGYAPDGAEPPKGSESPTTA